MLYRPDSTVQFYDEREMPQTVQDQIQHIADTSEMMVSTTQDAPRVSHAAQRCRNHPKEEAP